MWFFLDHVEKKFREFFLSDLSYKGACLKCLDSNYDLTA